MVVHRMPLILCLLSLIKLAYGQSDSDGTVQIQPSENEHFKIIFEQCCQTPTSCTRWRNTTGLISEPVDNLCATAGNVCNAQGFVQVLDASDLNMACSFPLAEISQFTTLQNLNISNNEELTGSLDKLTTQFICFMAENSLDELDISSTGIEGSVPECLLGDSGLETLALSNTRISSLPDGFTTNSKLESLDISNAALTGVLPQTLAFAPNLKVLNLRNNGLDGQIPEFSRRKSIEFVDLSNNNLIGAVPPSLAAHPSLLFLDARGNQLTSLPIEWTESVYDNSTETPFPIEEILLSKNDLQGPFPAGLAAFPALKTLDLADNSLSGKIPAADNSTGSWFPSLQVLDVSNNKFAGTEPAWISQVDESSVTGNSFGTPVPPEVQSPKPPSQRVPNSPSSSPPSSNASSDADSEEDSGLSGGAVAGIVIASLILASLLAGGAFVLIRRRQDRNLNGKFDRFVEM